MKISMTLIHTYLLAILAFIMTFLLGIMILQVAKEPHLGGHLSMSTATENVENVPQGEVLIELPSSWQIDVQGKEIGGWRQTGKAPGTLIDIADEVQELMAAHGFTETKMVDEEDMSASQRLIQYTASTGVKILWMLRDVGGNQTSFSWGREK